MITSINSNVDKSDLNRVIESQIKYCFRYVKNYDVTIVCDFPPVGRSIEIIDYLVFINIPYEKGNYYRVQDNENDAFIYINNIAFAIKIIPDNSIVSIDDANIYNKENGNYNYIEQIETDEFSFKDFMNDEKVPIKKLPFFYCFTSDSCNNAIEFEKCSINKSINIRHFIEIACQELNFTKKHTAYAFTDTSINYINAIKDIIEVANAKNMVGILTKKKMDLITSKQTQLIQRVIEGMGNQISIITGKAGTGKTFTLTRILYHIVKNDKHARLLTYNNLLVNEIKYNIKLLGEFRPTNASIGTLHQFFFKLTRRLGVQLLFTMERIEELKAVLEKRMEKIVNVMTRNNYTKIYYYDKVGKISPNHLAFISKYQFPKSDRSEIKDFFKWLMDYHLSFSLDEIELLKQLYIDFKIEKAETQLNNQVFLKDYGKVLEHTLSLLDDTQEFFKINDFASRYDYLNYFYKINNKDFVSKYDFEDSLSDDEKFKLYNELIKKVKNTAKWSKTILVDEGQDCFINEKLILFKLRGPNNLIVSTGGKDQLTRLPNEMDWAVSPGLTLKSEKYPLYNKSYRQKANIVDFVNAFYKEFNIDSELKAAPESKGRGQVIVDFRFKNKGFDRHKEITEEHYKQIYKGILSNGNFNGCSIYESLAILVPDSLYTDIKQSETINIDQTDTIHVTNSTFERVLDVNFFDESEKIWNGTTVSKNKLPVPSPDDIRVLFYDSCRGIESWGVMCIAVDKFFCDKYRSDEAEEYSVMARNLIIGEDELKREFAAKWVGVALTRAIDTLYISFSGPPFNGDIEEYNRFYQKFYSFVKSLGDKVTILEEKAPFIGVPVITI